MRRLCRAGSTVRVVRDRLVVALSDPGVLLPAELLRSRPVARHGDPAVQLRREIRAKQVAGRGLARAGVWRNAGVAVRGPTWKGQTSAKHCLLTAAGACLTVARRICCISCVCGVCGCFPRMQYAWLQRVWRLRRPCTPVAPRARLVGPSGCRCVVARECFDGRAAGYGVVCGRHGRAARTFSCSFPPQQRTVTLKLTHQVCKCRPLLGAIAADTRCEPQKRRLLGSYLCPEWGVFNVHRVVQARAEWQSGQIGVLHYM